MINMEKYEILLNEGLSLDHYYVLVMLYNNQKLSKHRKVQGFLNLLVKRGYIVEGGLLSERAIDLVQMDILENVVCSTTDTTTLNPNILEFNDWSYELHNKLETKLIELTNKKQIRDRVKGGKPYSFLCNPQDLAKNLKKITKLYKLENRRDEIERALIDHIEECYKANSWFPIIYYYIYKDNQSQLVNDLSAEKEESFSSDTIV